MVCNNNQYKPTKNFIAQSFMLGTDTHYQIYRSVSAPFFYLSTPIPDPVFVRESSVYILNINNDAERRWMYLSDGAYVR